MFIFLDPLDWSRTDSQTVKGGSERDRWGRVIHTAYNTVAYSFLVKFNNFFEFFSQLCIMFFFFFLNTIAK